jgi:hypothetical protein
MKTMFRFVLFFLYFLSASQAWGLSVTQHQYNVENVVFGINAYVYDASVNLRICDNQCTKSQSQGVIKGYFLALVSDFLATKKLPHKNSLDYVGDTHVYRIKAPQRYKQNW